MKRSNYLFNLTSAAVQEKETGIGHNKSSDDKNDLLNINVPSLVKNRMTVYSPYYFPSSLYEFLFLFSIFSKNSIIIH